MASGAERGSGRWRKPEDFGERSVLPPNKIVIEAHETPDLASRMELRRSLLPAQNQFLLLGVAACPLGVLTARNQKTLIDGPRAYLLIDMENVLIVDDVFEADGELGGRLFDEFERVDLGWLVADCVIQTSSSHGLLDRRELRAHFEWQLDKPLTIAEQKRVAEYINRRFGKKVADPVIYKSSRFFFPAKAELKRRDHVDGIGFRTSDVPPPPVQRLRLIPGHSRTLSVPPEALRGAPKAVPDLKRPTTAKAIGKLQPGNVHNYMIRRAFAVVKSTPWHRLPEAKEHLRQELAAGVMALNDASKLDARLAHVTGAAFETSWAGALAKRYRGGIGIVNRSCRESPPALRPRRARC